MHNVELASFAILLWSTYRVIKVYKIQIEVHVNFALSKLYITKHLNFLYHFRIVIVSTQRSNEAPYRRGLYENYTIQLIAVFQSLCHYVFGYIFRCAELPFCFLMMAHSWVASTNRAARSNLAFAILAPPIAWGAIKSYMRIIYNYGMCERCGLVSNSPHVFAHLSL